MSVSPAAGKPAPTSDLINVPRLIAAYYIERPDPSVPGQRVTFGTSGRRGSALSSSFNDPHILAIEADLRYPGASPTYKSVVDFFSTRLGR
jgi:phosphoglucomutase